MYVLYVDSFFGYSFGDSSVISLVSLVYSMISLDYSIISLDYSIISLVYSIISLGYSMISSLGYKYFKIDSNYYLSYICFIIYIICYYTSDNSSIILIHE